MVAAMLLGLEFPKNIAHSANSLTLIEEMATILPSGLIIGPHQLFSLTPSHESLSPPLSLKLVSLMFPTPLVEGGNVDHLFVECDCSKSIWNSIKRRCNHITQPSRNITDTIRDWPSSIPDFER